MGGDKNAVHKRGLCLRVWGYEQEWVSGGLVGSHLRTACSFWAMASCAACTCSLVRKVPLMMANSISCIFFNSSSPSGCMHATKQTRMSVYASESVVKIGSFQNTNQSAYISHPIPEDPNNLSLIPPNPSSFKIIISESYNIEIFQLKQWGVYLTLKY